MYLKWVCHRYLILKSWLRIRHPSSTLPITCRNVYLVSCANVWRKCRHAVQNAVVSPGTHTQLADKLDLPSRCVCYFEAFQTSVSKKSPGSLLRPIGALACKCGFKSYICQENCITIVWMYVPVPVPVHDIHKICWLQLASSCHPQHLCFTAWICKYCT